MKILPVIIAGGKGSRLWPISRAMHPKQFLKIDGKDTMLQSTISRLKGLNLQDPIIICNDDHRFFVAEQLLQLGLSSNIILEPEGKNTAPAIALAAHFAKEDDILLVLPADHIIKDNKIFIDSIMNASNIAMENKLVTFGVTPSEANTGYGYIKKESPFMKGHKIEEFIEKPNKDKAEEFLKSNQYLWNSGMFLFKAKTYIDELNKFRPDINNLCRTSILNSTKDLDFIRPRKKEFLACPSESIDYAVMENTQNGIVIEMAAKWSDVGSWSSLWNEVEKDSNNNATHGDVIAYKTNNSYIRSENCMIAAVGVSNLIIISTKDSILVADKDKSQDIKEIVDLLKKDGRSEYLLNREVYRPWGKYDSIDNGKNFQAKRITVNPGAKLSVQKHFRRSEHWIVVSGTATVTNGDKTFQVLQNQSTYIPVGTIHALENKEKFDLELIEVQTGDYFGEDDIVRFDDIYGRSD